MNRICFIIFLCISLAASTANGKSFPRFHLDHRDGLCNNYVRGIGQDGHGYIWVATYDGLARFDGRCFTKYTKENSGLTGNELNCVIPDPINPDILWIGSRHDGLCYYNYATGSITPIDYNRILTTDITDMSVSPDNKIWITHYHFPPEKYDPLTDSFKPLFKHTPKNLPLQGWCAREDSKGDYLYIGHDNGGLSRVNLKTLEIDNYRHIDGDNSSISGNFIYCLFLDSDGNVWAGTENGVSVFNPTTEKFYNIYHSNLPGSLLPGAVKSIAGVKNGDIWFATDQGGISILPFEQWKNNDLSFVNLTPDVPIGFGRSLSSSNIVKIFEDSFGNKWLGNYSDGIDVLSYAPPFFQQIEPFPVKYRDNMHQAVWSAALDNDGNIWLGGEDRIMRTGDALPQTFTIPKSSDLSHAIVRALNFDKKGKLWVGTSNSGAYHFNPASSSFSPVTNIDREVRCFWEEKDGKVLIGTRNGIYYSTDGCSGIRDSALNSNLTDLYVTSMLRDNNGNLWVGTFGQGVSVISQNGKLRHTIKIKDGIPSNTINDIFEDSKGHIWLATREGAVEISPDHQSIIGVYDENETNNPMDVKSIEEGKDGRIWLSTTDGISSLNPNSNNVSTYSRAYRSNLSSFIENCSGICGNGLIFFGSLNGLAFFNSGSYDKTISDNKIMISRIYAHDNNSPSKNHEIIIPVNSDKITLPYNLNTFRLKFDMPDITEAVNSEFIYNMKGVNEVWSSAGTGNEAEYRNLKPGSYEFRVRHRLNGEEWKDPETLAYIKITPPIYLTWWAKTIYILLAITAIVLFIYFYKNKLNLEKNLAIEKENNKNIQMLNEERLIFYTNITHELRTPLSLIVGPIEDLINAPGLRDEHRKKLHTIRTSSMRLLNLINGILEFRKTETRNRKLEVTYGDFANYVREIGLRFKELNNNRNVAIVIDVADLDGAEMYYDPEIITSILNNLLGNALKYTKEGTITLSLKYSVISDTKYVDISVADTGEGISKDHLPHIFKRYYQAGHNKKVAGTGIGLALTKNLVDLHEGSIFVESEENKGSTFTVRMILNNTYPNALHKTSATTSRTDNEYKTDNETHKNLEKLTLLIVEDDDDMRDYIVHAFNEDFNVLSAANGKEGLDIVHEQLPDIVISDIMMPVMDGFELCHAIKSDMMFNHIPVILLTAKDSLLDKEEGYKSGADSYITKPFSATLLLSRINNLMTTRHTLSLHYLGLPAGTPPQEEEETFHLAESSPEQTEDPACHSTTALSPFDREFINKLRNLIEENIEIEEMDMSFLTDKMCMSHSTLYRKVKGITGLTPNEFIRKIKLCKATALLLSGAVPFAEIPFLTGFNSAAYFRRVFKKEYGISPTEYVRQHAPSAARSFTADISEASTEPDSQQPNI